MSELFDPYYKWLGIPPEEQPPSHYRLLAIRPFENDADVIDAAAEQRMTLLRSRQTGRHAAASQQLLNEISAARACLLDDERRRAYDAELRADAETPLPEPLVEPAAVEPLSSLLDDLPQVDPLATPPAPSAPAALAADYGVAYGSGRYAPPKTPAPGLMLLAIGLAVVLLIGVLAVSVGVGYVLLADSPEEVARGGGVVRIPKSPPKPNTPPPGTPPPFAAPSGQTIDLLERIDPARDAVHGDFRFEDGDLIVPPLQAAQLELPVAPPSSYRLEAVAQRLSGVDAFQLGLVCGEGETMMVFDAFEPKVSGLNLLNGRSADRNQTRRPGVLFDDDQPHRIVCTVHPGKIHVAFDGETVVDWQGDSRSLSLRRMAVRLRNERRLRVAGWESRFRVSELRLTELPDE